MTRYLPLVLLILIFGACSDDDPQEDDMMDDMDEEITFEVTFPELTFERPIFLTHSGDGSGELYVAEQAGVIQKIRTNSVTIIESFLDIRDRVNSSDNEQGLLGLAFHPDFQDNGLFYVNYTGAGSQTVIAEFISGSSGSEVNTGSERIILEIDQPFTNHNGGMIAFGPDGYLYIATGDGGSGGDPQNNAQNRSNLLGKVLRIDVDGRSVDNSYSIPTDNPFAGNSDGFREEIYAYGLRNPWRFSFDAQTGDLWLADVGQNEIEEVDLVVSGGNYGWNIMEGSECFLESPCDSEGLEQPVSQYDHNLGSSITGGYVYRGSRLSTLAGSYFYGDFVSGRIWTTTTENQSTELFADTSFNISSFGTDENDELYLLNFADGKIYTLTSN